MAGSVAQEDPDDADQRSDTETSAAGVSRLRHGHLGHSRPGRARGANAEETARRFLEDEATRFGVSLDPADVLLCRAQNGTEMHIMAAADELVLHLRTVADPFGEDSPVMVLARAGALALMSRTELDGLT
jgi:hypothetical protein